MFAQLLGFSFGFGPTSACRLPSGFCSHSDRTGLKQRLIRGLWLTHARGWRVQVIIGMQGEPAVSEAGVTLQQPETHCMFSQGTCPWITRPWQWQAEQAPRGTGGWCVDSDLCLHTGLGGCSHSVSVSCLSLGSELIAMARACLWSLFRQCCAFCGQKGKESPLLKQPKTMVSCLFSRSRLFLSLPPG